jgi:alanine-synthesizing transaminase
MFSTRTRWDLQPNRLTRRLAELRHGGAYILDLSESNPTHASLAYPAESLLPALTHPDNLSYDPAARGLFTARQAVVEYYRQRNILISADQIFLSSGTSESYAHLFQLLGDPGDRFLVPCPSYPLFEFLAGLECVITDFYPLVWNGRWHIDFEALRKQICTNTRAILFVHPNNPTGSYLKKEEMAELQQICLERNLALILDEVFFDYPLEKSVDTVSWPNGESLGIMTFVLNGLSKISALPQMKLAWIVADGPQPELQQAMERLELAHDTFLSVSTPIQNAAASFLEMRKDIQEQIGRRLRKNLDHLACRLQNSAAQALPVEGGWYVVVRMPEVVNEESWVLGLLEEEKVLVHPGYFFDFQREAYLVFSLLTPEPIFQEGVRRFLHHLQRILR